MLGSVVSEEVYMALKDNVVLSDEQVWKSLWQLPGDWPKGRTTHHPAEYENARSGHRDRRVARDGSISVCQVADLTHPSERRP